MQSSKYFSYSWLFLEYWSHLNTQTLSSIFVYICVWMILYMHVHASGAHVPWHTFSDQYTPSTSFGSLVCCYIYRLAGCKLLGILRSLPPISLFECWNCRNLPLWLALLGFWKYELRSSHLYKCFSH